MYRELNRPLRLLLVEDNPVDVRLLQIGLAQGPANCQIQVASDGEEAIQLLFPQGRPTTSQRPDLILLDLNLPKLNGHDVLQRLKRDPELCTIPVMILTSSRLPSDILATYRQGANSYLAKPENLEEAYDLARTLQHYWLELALLPVPPAPP